MFPPILGASSTQVPNISHIDVSVPEVRIELHRLLIGLKSEWVGVIAGVIPQSFLEPAFRRFFRLEVFDSMFHFFGEVVQVELEKQLPGLGLDEAVFVTDDGLGAKDINTFIGQVVVEPRKLLFQGLNTVSHLGGLKALGNEALRGLETDQVLEPVAASAIFQIAGCDESYSLPVAQTARLDAQDIGSIPGAETVQHFMRVSLVKA